MKSERLGDRNEVDPPRVEPIFLPWFHFQASGQRDMLQSVLAAERRLRSQLSTSSMVAGGPSELAYRKPFPETLHLLSRG
jgi:hypothetical protein